ncbi:alpha/beta-hydrolase [Paraphaeosphaeria sporulosa]|uniref:Alpha/beta-hydrolase n=1 Tax=Paraphaeosphaeria sporulosa TaxID=1460663 RepID=A0A177CHX6_9PLEO|nr:alpha/beta-hydrolase [Paraphaeosphaeria sporulosa]OAG06449.1 alpha/beta-hydrolase [Paraphaeosphaeria sporulosa]
MSPTARFSVVASLLSYTIAFPLTPRQPSASSSSALPSNCTAPSITFGSCPEEAPSQLECATYSVPINWDEPEGEKFDLGLVRLPANVNSTKKIGSLFINPGGPGGAASDLIASLILGALPIPEGLNDAFDLIGLDPRGVGLSNAVQCDQKIWAERVSWFPKTQEDYDTLVDKNKRYGESCRNKTGPLLEHLDTISVAKDHEAVRIALGNEPLNMVGLSYGSQLGAQYAQLFPDNIRTLVLDGMLQHSQAAASNVLIESLGYSIGLQHFFEWASEEVTSPLKGEDVAALCSELLKNASTTSIPAPACDGTSCRTDVNAEELLFNAQEALTFKDPRVTGGLSTWGDLASAIYNATHGDASALSTRFDEAAAGTAIYCLDLDHDPAVYDFNYMQTTQHMFSTFHPLSQGTGQSTSLLHSCVGWPYATRNPPKKLHVDTEATILMVNSDADPSTAYPWAVGMLEEIKNKVFVTRHGDGHTSFFTGGETASTIVRYLLGEAPVNGLVLDS